MDETAFAAFHGRHARALWAYVYRVTGHGADADDIVQEAFLRLLRAGPATAQEDERRRYLFRIASNLIIDRWRAGARGVEAPGSPATEAGVDEDRDRDVARTFATLSARDRALLWLAYVEEESHAEIAASLGLGTRSVKVLLFRAKRRLKDLLKARGLART